jgi:stage II sporulation protein M
MKSFRIIRDNRGYVWFGGSLFVLGLLMGSISYEALQPLLQQSLEKIKEIAKDAQGDSLSMTLLLFKNNFTASIIMILSGVLLSIYPLIGLLMNGMVVGYVMALTAKTGQIPIWALVSFGILPHGILEIPAFLLAGAMGIKLGYMWLRPLVGKTRLQSVGSVFIEVLYVIPVIFVLLAAAAAIEGFLTPQLLNWYLE